MNTNGKPPLSVYERSKAVSQVPHAGVPTDRVSRVRIRKDTFVCSQALGVWGPSEFSEPVQFLTDGPLHTFLGK